MVLNGYYNQELSVKSAYWDIEDNTENIDTFKAEFRDLAKKLKKIILSVFVLLSNIRVRPNFLSRFCNICSTAKMFFGGSHMEKTLCVGLLL